MQGFLTDFGSSWSQSVPTDAAGRAGDPAALLNVHLPDTPLTDVLQRVVELATRSIDTCADASVTLAHKGRLRSPVATGERPLRIDEVQYTHGAGPCVQAFRTGEVHIIADTSADRRWPEFAAAALAEGIRSTLSVPLDVSGTRTEVFGALNLYSEELGGFSGGAVAATDSFAHQAVIVVANAQAYWGARELSDQLQGALESRTVIEQAKGVLVAREGVSLDRAFEMLVQASQREHRKLRDVAAEVVERAASA